MIEAATTDALGTISAGAVTAAAGYVSAKVRGISRSIEEAQQKAEESKEKAQENRELIAGDPEAGPSIFDRLERMEREIEADTRIRNKRDD